MYPDPGWGRLALPAASLVDKGKPDVSRGRKATGPTRPARLERENIQCASPPSSAALLRLPAIEMSILVAYATMHGATGEIAERIAEGPRPAGQHAEARPVQEAGDLADYEGFVIGSAAFSTHWSKDATAFVRSNRDLLAQRPVWLFSSGPLGPEATDAKAVNLSAAFEPKEICGFQVAIDPRDHGIFFGALDRDRLSSPEWSCLKQPVTRAILPEGDFRDWAQIEEWVRGIAQQLTPPGHADPPAETVLSLRPPSGVASVHRRPQPGPIAVSRFQPAFSVTRQQRTETSCSRGEGPGSRQPHATCSPAANEDVFFGAPPYSCATTTGMTCSCFPGADASVKHPQSQKSTGSRSGSPCSSPSPEASPHRRTALGCHGS